MYKPLRSVAFVRTSGLASEVHRVDETVRRIAWHQMQMPTAPNFQRSLDLPTPSAPSTTTECKRKLVVVCNPIFRQVFLACVVLRCCV